MRSLLACVALVSLSGAVANAQMGSVFPPLEQWKAAVNSGDAAAIAGIYSSNPPARLLAAGKPLADSAEEWKFWAELKSQGVKDFNPKLLEITRGPDQVRLLLRVQFLEGDQPMVASVTQLWVRTAGAWRIGAAARGARFVPDGKRTLPEPVTPKTDLYPDPSQAESELKTALASAATQHKRVIVVFGGNWCYDCHVLDEAFHSKDIAPLVDPNFIVVHISVGDDGKSNTALAARLGVGLEKGYPSLGVLDPDGSTVFGQKDGEFESSLRIGPADVRAFLTKWKPAK